MKWKKLKKSALGLPLTDCGNVMMNALRRCCTLFPLKTSHRKVSQYFEFQIYFWGILVFFTNKSVLK